MKKLSKTGYKKDSPDKNNPYNVIPSKNITMKDVPHRVYGQDQYGNGQIMEPGLDYIFPGNRVTEVPLMQQGGQSNYTAAQWNKMNVDKGLLASPGASINLSGKKYMDFYDPTQYKPSIQNSGTTSMVNWNKVNDPNWKFTDENSSPFISYNPSQQNIQQKQSKSFVQATSNRTAVGFQPNYTTYKYNDGSIKYQDTKGNLYNNGDELQGYLQGVTKMQEGGPVNKFMANYAKKQINLSQAPQGQSMDDFLTTKNLDFLEFIATNNKKALVNDEMNNFKTFQKGGQNRVSDMISKGLDIHNKNTQSKFPNLSGYNEDTNWLGEQYKDMGVSVDKGNFNFGIGNYVPTRTFQPTGNINPYLGAGYNFNNGISVNGYISPDSKGIGISKTFQQGGQPQVNNIQSDPNSNFYNGPFGPYMNQPLPSYIDSFQQTNGFQGNQFGVDQDNSRRNNNIADLSMVAVQTTNSLFNRYYAKQQDLKNQKKFGIENTTQLQYGNRGDYDVNNGQFRPNQYTIPSFQMGGSTGNDIELSRRNVVQDLMKQGIKDPSQILNFINYDEGGNLVGDFDLNEVKRHMGVNVKEKEKKNYQNIFENNKLKSDSTEKNKSISFKKGGEVKKYKRGGEYNVSDSELSSLLSSGYEFDIID